MSREIVDELIDRTKEASKEDFPQILSEVLEYGFASDSVLADTLGVEYNLLDDMLEEYEETDRLFKRHKSLLIKYLNKEKATYTRLFYADPKPS